MAQQVLYRYVTFTKVRKDKGCSRFINILSPIDFKFFNWSYSMNSHLLAFDSLAAESGVSTRKKADVLPINSAASRFLENLSATPSAALVLGRFNQGVDYRDSKAIDYLVIGILSILIHAAAVDFFKKIPIEREELIEPIKPPSKMQISFVQPKPKPVVQPPPPPIVKQQPPPPPKVVAINKPPKPKVKPKPVAVQQPPLDLPVSKTVFDAPVSTAPVATPSPPAPKVVEKVTAPSSGAGYLHNPTPDYPESAMERGLEGRVVMKVHVLANGRPSSVSVTKSSGHDILDEEAVRTVKQWTFVPGKRGSTPIDGWVTVPMAFNLQS
jgi:protein TonB